MDPLYTLQVVITKVLQSEKLPDEHSITIKVNNLVTQDTIDMETELAPSLLAWIPKDEPSQPAS